MVNRFMLIAALAIFFQIHSIAQKKVTIEVEPSPTVVEANKPLQIKVIAKDEDGNTLEETENFYWPVQIKGVDENLYFAKQFNVDSTGTISASVPGEYQVMIYRVPGKGEAFTQIMHLVKVINQPVAKIETSNVPTSLYEGAITTLDLKIIDEGGVEVDEKSHQHEFIK